MTRLDNIAGPYPGPFRVTAKRRPTSPTTDNKKTDEAPRKTDLYFGKDLVNLKGNENSAKKCPVELGMKAAIPARKANPLKN